MTTDAAIGSIFCENPAFRLARKDDRSYDACSYAQLRGSKKIFLKRKFALDKSGNSAIIQTLPLAAINESVGVDWPEGPPVPIPNTEVKLRCVDDSMRVTACENR